MSFGNFLHGFWFRVHAKPRTPALLPAAVLKGRHRTSRCAILCILIGQVLWEHKNRIGYRRAEKCLFCRYPRINRRDSAMARFASQSDS